MPNLFNFYQAAYKINQGGASIGLTSIKMGTSTSPIYTGLAFYLNRTLYADIDSISFNADLYIDYYIKNFSTSGPLELHEAAYLADCNFGPAVPKLGSTHQFQWDKTCYPSALGDTRDNEKYGNLRDGSWVEAGYNGNLNYINIYTINPAPWQEPIWTNSINCSNNFASTFPNCRVFTSPSFISDNVPGIGVSGLVLIAYFAWSSTGGVGGGPILYYELFGWDPVSNIIASITSVDITSTFGEYHGFVYTGKHDMFHTARWNGPQNYSQCTFLSVLTNGGWLLQFDILTGTPTKTRANAGAYSDVYDVFAYAENITSTFFTIVGSVGLTAPIDSQILVDPIKVFDADYRPFPAGSFLQDNYFYFGDDQQAASPSRIVGWSLEIDSVGFFSSAGGLRSSINSVIPNPPPGTPPNTPYVLNRVVVVSPMQLIVSSGPGHGTYPLIRITCNYSGGSWYKSGEALLYDSGSNNEDYIAMFHGFCEDFSGYFHPSGVYTSGYEAGLPVGAGNGHLLTVSGYMDLAFYNHNVGSLVASESWSGGASYQHYTYVIYLGKCVWINSPSSDAYCYINITGGNDFLLSSSGLGFNTVFTAPSGKLRTLSFYC
jgi:hypothetical protein